MYETVFLKGPDELPHPGLADSWTVQEGGREWHIRLRSGLRFHSGAPCDLRAVLETLNHLRWDFYGDRQLWYWDSVSDVTAREPDVLVFRLAHPNAGFPSLLWGTHTAIMNQAVRASSGDEFGHSVEDGTGPFTLETWSESRIVARRWPDYPGIPARFLGSTGPARTERIEWVSLPDEADRVAALTEGEVDAIHAPAPDTIDFLMSRPDIHVVSHPQRSNIYLALNWQRADLGFDEVNVRRAIARAIDRTRLVKEAVGGRGEVTYGPLPPGDPYYDRSVDEGQHPDPRAAAEMLDASGWRMDVEGVRRRGQGRLEFDCVIQDEDVHRRVGASLASQLEPLGIRLRLQTKKPFDEFYDACRAGAPSFVNKWIWQDPMDAIIGFAATWCRPFPNCQHASIPELDRAFAAWREAITEEDRHHAASAAQRVTASELPYIPLLTPQDLWAHHARVTGWVPYQANIYPYYQTTQVQGGSGDAES